MSAREAYIAGRSGKSRPPTKQTRGSDPSETQRNTQQQDREQKSFDAGQQERQREVRAQVTKKKGTGPNVKGGLTEKELEQARNIASGAGGIPTLKDPYNVLTREEERKAGYPETFSEKAIDAYKEYANFGGFAGLGALPFRMIAEPTVKTFQNPKTLASLKLLFDRKGQKFKDRYLKDYEGLIDEAFKDFDSGITMGLNSNEILDLQLNQASDLAQQGILGADSQRINFPEEFYTGENTASSYPTGIMPQTTGDLENLANLDAQQYLQGENYNPELAKMIFNARATLDQNKGNQGGGGAGIPSLATAPTPFTDVNNNGILDNLETTQATTTPVTATTPVIGVPSLTPTTIDYASMGPQYGGYVNQGISDPRFASYFQNLNLFPRRS